jgi:general nucleoside transport system permease protein
MAVAQLHLQRHHLDARIRSAFRWAGWLGIVLVAFTALVLAYGKNPIDAYHQIFASTLTSGYGLSQVVIRMIPLLIAAMAVAVPARVGLVNVGGEGQMYVGALLGSWAALSFGSLPSWLLIPLMLVMAFVGGGVWGAFCGFLRARGWLSEVFSTVLLNYVGILLVSFVVYGPWRDPASANYPQSREISTSAQFPAFGGSGIHVGIFIGLAAVLLFAFVLRHTTWGLQIRAIGGNPFAAARNGIPVVRYLVVAMLIGGGLAGLAGISQVAGIDHRLGPGLSANYGYIGFLVSWLAGHRPLRLIPIAFLLAVLAVGGDILQITQGMPYAAITVLMALVLFAVLAGRARGSTP